MAPTEHLSQRLEALRAVVHGRPLGAWSARVRLDSAANLPRGQSKWAAVKKSKAVAGQRGVGALALAQLDRTRVRCLVSTYPFVAVRLVRHGPKLLDSDNLDSAFKGVRDGFARALGIDDADPRVRYVTDQVAGGGYAVTVELYGPAQEQP